MRDEKKHHQEALHRTVRRKKTDLPGSERVRVSPLRVVAVSVAAILAMLAGLRLAVVYAERDWADKNAVAHGWGNRIQAADSGEADRSGVPVRWRYEAGGRGEEALRVAGRPGNGRASWAASAAAAAKRREERSARMAIRLATACGGDWAAAANLEGTLALEAGNTGEARGHFRSAAGANRAAAYNLAVCDWAEGHRTEAIAALAAFVMRRDADEGAVRMLGRWLWQSGRRAETVSMLRRHAPPGSSLLLDLATHEALRGDTHAAVAALSRALDGVALTKVIQTFQSPAFREAAMTEEGRVLLGELANRARATLGAVPREKVETGTGERRAMAASALLRY